MYTPFAFTRTQPIESTDGQGLETLGRMTRGVVHDFNNLLVLISGHAQLLMDKSSDVDRRDLEAIRKAAMCGTELTNYLLRFSRGVEAPPAATCVNDIVLSLASLLPRMMGKDFEIATFLGEDLPTVEANPVQIQQVILNLALNARDAMPAGGKILIKTECPDRAQFRSWWRPSFVLLSVTDNGHGMDEKTRSRMFESLFSTKATGNGIGLSIVSDITKQLGGRVEVASAVGQGTTVNIHLPVRSRTAVA